jgi:5-methylcytosine-specific restriction protein A
MGVRRQPKEIWFENTRPRVFSRDNGKCVRCQIPLTLKTCHIDHIKSGLLGSNHIDNLRTLCRRCHVLRADSRHRGMIASALRDGIIDHQWRSEVWEG